jgi:hypothetical protein
MMRTEEGGAAMKLRCLLRGHTWGPIEGMAHYPVHTCKHCGKTKKLSSAPDPDHGGIPPGGQMPGPGG